MLAMLPATTLAVTLDDASRSSAPERPSAALEEVVVTARKRAESLQEVPVSAAVVSGAEIAERDLASIQDLTTTLPGVKFAKGGVTDSQFIRGIGSGDNPSFEQSVGIFVDDIYYGRARSAEGTLFDIERVEVLKGPQITYFGNNAIAGALNILTRDPGTTLAGNTRISYTPRFDGYAAEAGVDLPAGSTVAVRLAVFATGSDGWIKDYGTGEDVPHTRNEAVRSTILWKPTGQLTARLKAQYSQERERGGLPIVRSNCPQSSPFPSPEGFCAVALGAGAAPYSDAFARNSSAGQITRLTTEDYVGTLNLVRGAFTLSSVTGYTHFIYGLDTDLDLTPLNLLSATAPERYEQHSQELRIASNDNGPIEYIGGLYYQHSRLDLQTAFIYGFLSPQIAAIPTFAPLLPYLPLGVGDQFRESSATESAFGALTWKMTERIRVAGALRYSQVNKDFEQAVGVGTASADYGPVIPFPATVAPLGAAFAKASGLATVGTLSLSRKDAHLSPSLSVQYTVMEGAMLYARYDNGFKAGGFNGADLTGNAAALPFSPEKVDSFEIGAKTKLFDSRALFDIDVFRSQYRNLQLAGILPSTGGAYVNRVQNAGGAVSRGAEVEAAVLITPQLRTSLSGTYLHDRYTSYPNATPTALQTLQGLPGQNLAGQETPFAPKFSGSWTLSYAVNASSVLVWRIENRLFASSRFLLAFNNDPGIAQRGYAREDLTVSIAGKSGITGKSSWDVAVTGQNLGNRTIRTYGAEHPVSLGSYGFMTEPPRSITIQVAFNF
jgi:outer membrane receptor protein involved in Fe transport